MTLYVVFLIVALILFILAVIPIPSRVNLTACGLVFCVLAALVGHITL